MNMIRIGKVVLVFGVGLFLFLAAVNNSLGMEGAFGAVKGVVDMQATFKVPTLMWRAIENPMLIWILLVGIVVAEYVGGVLCLWGAARMWSARASSANFNASKHTALVGLTVAAILYSVPFLAICGEWFMLWQNRESHTLEESFRQFVWPMLVMMWVNTADE
jgi:predicted small integral membrane protein